MYNYDKKTEQLNKKNLLEIQFKMLVGFMLLSLFRVNTFIY